MQALNSLALAAGAGALALGALAAPPASAADIGVPQGQYYQPGPPPQYYGAPPQGQYEQGPPPQYYGPPPAEEDYAYPPPPAAEEGYAYPPPPAVVYAVPPGAVAPGPYYYGPAPYWRGWYGYGPHFAYGWGRPYYRRW